MKHTSIIAAVAAASLCVAVSCKSSEKSAVAIPVEAERKLPQNMHQAESRVLIIMYDVNIGSEPLIKAAKEYGAEIVYQYDNINGIALRVPDGKIMPEAVQYFNAVEGVLTVNIDKPVRLM